MTRFEESALALHGYLVSRHWRQDAVIGPDSGVRFNYRIGRFVKSYLRWLPWRDDLYYLQAQAYWILANWNLFELTGSMRYRELADRCAAGVLRAQRPDGAWDYPNREWSGRIATVEGTWASIGLLQSFRHSGDQVFLDGALRWFKFLEERIGWRRSGLGLAVNYFVGDTAAPVPNNSTVVLWNLGELASVTGDERYLARCHDIVRFLADAQRASGELPYALGAEGTRHEHFQCAQYNAFQCVDLLRYRELTGDNETTSLIRGLLRFLSSQVHADGSVNYSCRRSHPQVSYHLAALASALGEGASADLAPPDAASEAQLIYRRLLSLQRPDGSFPHSIADYRLLHDGRAYPRNQAMILVHLLVAMGARPTMPVTVNPGVGS